MAAGARDPRIRLTDLQFLLRYGAEASEMVVRGPGQQTGERNGDVEVGSHVQRPFVALVVACTFAGELVGVGTVEARGLR